jgi:hypothetical protein
MNSDEEDEIARPERLPIYRKGKEILDIVSKIAALIPENDEYLEEVKAWMLCDAALLTVKVAGAEAAGLYDLKMENAAIIRKAARDPMVCSAKTPTMTYRFMVLKKIPKNEKQSNTPFQYFNISGHVI